MNDEIQPALLAYLSNRLAELLIIPEDELGHVAAVEAAQLRRFLAWVQTK